MYVSPVVDYVGDHTIFESNSLTGYLANNGGGGLYCDGQSTYSSSCKLAFSKFIDNKAGPAAGAATSFGGAIFAGQRVLLETDFATFSGNSDKVRGAAVSTRSDAYAPPG
jgi:hypothetical protein